MSRLFILFLIFGYSFVSLGMGDARTCAGAMINRPGTSFEVDYRLALKHPAEMTDVVPDYVREEDILFVITNHHTSLYFGRYFWDWSPEGYRVRRNPRVIPAGVFSKIHVGKSIVNALETSTETKAYEKIGFGTCELRTLYYLQQHGVYLNGQVPLTGLNLFETIVGSGFTDQAGKPFPTKTIAIHLAGTDPVKTSLDYLKAHHVGYFLLFLNGYGVSTPEFVGLLGELTKDKELSDMPRLMLDEALHPYFTPRQRAFMLDMIRLTEQKTLARIDQFAGSTHAALNLMMSQGFDYRLAHDAIYASLREAMIETLPNYP